jgi:serine protease AprX
MKKILASISFLFIITFAVSQVAPDRYWVKFTDKNNTPYSISNPDAFLSQKAIDRRIVHDIPIMENDLPVDPVYIQGVISTGATLLNASKWFNSITIFTSDPSVVSAINTLPYVLSVEKSIPNPNIIREKFVKPFFENESYAKIPEDDFLKSGASGMVYNYGQAYNQINMVNGIPLHDDGYDGQGMTIAVLDAGFLNANTISAFDYLWDNGKILGYKDFVNPSNPDIFGSHSHGTSVLSTMGANLAGQMVGTAPQANYWLLRSEDASTEFLIEELNWVSAAEFADSVGADIINSSLGYTTFDDPAQSHSYADMDGNTAPVTIGADIAVSKGMIVVNSAGNSGSSQWLYIGAPADGDSVFSIGAVNSSGSYASFSSIGPTYDGRLKPNVVAQGQGTTIISAFSGDVVTGSGTSFSSPVTAGMVACLWQSSPLTRNMNILETIQLTGSHASNPNYQVGYGIPDYYMAFNLITDSGPEIRKDQLLLYPNPFKDQLTIKFNHDAGYLTFLKIIDLTGKVVIDAGLINHSGLVYKIEGLDRLASGVYFLTAGFEKSIITQQIIRK